MKATDKQISYLIVLSAKVGDSTNWEEARKNGLTKEEASAKISELKSSALGSNLKRKCVTKIKITAVYTDIPAEIYFGQFLLLRSARKVGDIESVNNYQLGKLNEAQSYGGIKFEKI